MTMGYAYITAYIFHRQKNHHRWQMDLFCADGSICRNVDSVYPANWSRARVLSTVQPLIHRHATIAFQIPHKPQPVERTPWQI